MTKINSLSELSDCRNAVGLKLFHHCCVCWLQGMRQYIDIIHEHLEIHATVTKSMKTRTNVLETNVPKYVINHGILNSTQLYYLLKQSKVGNRNVTNIAFPYRDDYARFFYKCRNVSTETVKIFVKYWSSFYFKGVCRTQFSLRRPSSIRGHFSGMHLFESKIHSSQEWQKYKIFRGQTNSTTG